MQVYRLLFNPVYYWNLFLRINSFTRATAALTLVVILMRIGLASAKKSGLVFFFIMLEGITGCSSILFDEKSNHQLKSWLSIAFHPNLFPNAVFCPLITLNSGITIYRHVQLPNVSYAVYSSISKNYKFKSTVRINIQIFNIHLYFKLHTDAK